MEGQSSVKIQYKHQKFQADAAKAIVDVFAGQPYRTSSYMVDMGVGMFQQTLLDVSDFSGWCNARIVPQLTDDIVLEHIQKIQRNNQIAPSPQLEGHYSTPIIRGIDGDELVGLVLKYYDLLDEKYRKMIPLKMIYIPVAKEEQKQPVNSHSISTG